MSNAGADSIRICVGFSSPGTFGSAGPPTFGSSEIATGKPANSAVDWL